MLASPPQGEPDMFGPSRTGSADAVVTRSTREAHPGSRWRRSCGVPFVRACALSAPCQWLLGGVDLQECRQHQAHHGGPEQKACVPWMLSEGLHDLVGTPEQDVVGGLLGHRPGPCLGSEGAHSLVDGGLYAPRAPCGASLCPHGQNTAELELMVAAGM